MTRTPQAAARPDTGPAAIHPAPRARGAAVLATLAVAALAAITQTACIEPRDSALALDLAAAFPAAVPVAATASPADAANGDRCAALRQADRLDARLGLDYRQVRALPTGARLRQRHGADVQGTLQLLQRDEAGAVWSGPVQQGLLALDDRIDGAGDRAMQLAGRGTPRSGAALAGSVLTVRVAFADCSLHYAARLALDATSRQADRATAVPWQELGRLSLSQPAAALTLTEDGTPVLAGARQVPARPQLLDSGYRPGGLATVRAEGAEAAAGTARLRWRFTPLRSAEALPLA